MGGNSKHLNIADGVILTEAFRYALEKVERLGLLRRGFSFQVTDCREARAPFSTYQDILVISGMTSYQTSSYYVSNYVAKAPMTSVLSSSSAFDHVHVSSSGSRPRMDKVRQNLFRTVPSDNLEVWALVDILKHLNFTFVSVVGSNDLRTQETVENFNSLAVKRGVCIGNNVWISVNPNEKEYQNIIAKLTRPNSPKVTVLLTTTNEALGVIDAARNVRDLTFISGTSLRANIFEAKFNSAAADGIILLQNADTFDEGFRDYFMSLKLRTNKYSWFAEYWSMVFNCSIPYDYRLFHRSYFDRRPHCSGEETLTEERVDLRYANVKPLLMAFETMVCALMRSEDKYDCNPTERGCKTKIMRGAVKYMGKQTCVLNNSIFFNERGFYGNGFKILNFNGSRYHEVGAWSSNGSLNTSSLSLSFNQIRWKGGKHALSQCYQECGYGAIEDRGEDGSVCCYKCKQCADNQITLNSTCRDCPKYEVPNIKQTTCVKLPVIYIESQSVYISVLISAASIGLILNTLFITIFISYRDYKVVKATGRELSLFILATLYLSFALPFLFLVKPSLIVCGIQRFIMSLSMNACYTPLMLKTNRVYRIFQASKILVRKLSMVSTKSQFLICIALIMGQLLLDIVWVVSDLPAMQLQLVESKGEVALTCKSNPINAVLNLLPCFLLMSACTFFGYKTRNFPSNFNEAFSISITMYISCFLWAIYIPLLFLFDYKRNNVYDTSFLTAYFMVLLGLITLIGIFGPTVYRVFMNNDAGTQNNQFFHSDNTPSSASTVLGNKLATSSYPIGQSRTPSMTSTFGQRHTGTDPVVFTNYHTELCSGSKYQNQNWKASPNFQKDVGTDPIILEDYSLKLHSVDHLKSRVLRKRLNSV